MVMTRGSRVLWSPVGTLGPLVESSGLNGPGWSEQLGGAGGVQMLTPTAHGSDSSSRRLRSKRVSQCPKQSAPQGSGI